MEIKFMEHSSFFPDCFHRVTIKGLCVRDGKILLMREGDIHGGKWELPGGGLDFGEDMKAALQREVEEEMRLKVRKISEKPVYIWTYKYENKRGMDWFYSLVIAYRIEFENEKMTPTDEAEEVKFFSKAELKDLEYAGQSKMLIDIFNPEDFTENFS